MSDICVCVYLINVFLNSPERIKLSAKTRPTDVFNSLMCYFYQYGDRWAAPLIHQRASRIKRADSRDIKSRLCKHRKQFFKRTILFISSNQSITQLSGCLSHKTNNFEKNM